MTDARGDWAFLGILLVEVRAAGHRVPEFAWYFSDRGAAHGRGTVRKRRRDDGEDVLAGPFLFWRSTRWYECDGRPTAGLMCLQAACALCAGTHSKLAVSWRCIVVVGEVTGVEPG